MLTARELACLQTFPLDWVFEGVRLDSHSPMREVAERLGRRWACCDAAEEYLRGAVGRFVTEGAVIQNYDETSYSIYRPGFMWGCDTKEPLDINGGRERKSKKISVAEVAECSTSI